MRAVAMKLHTKEQAPKEGGIEAPKRKPVSDNRTIVSAMMVKLAAADAWRFPVQHPQWLPCSTSSWSQFD